MRRAIAFALCLVTASTRAFTNISIRRSTAATTPILYAKGFGAEPAKQEKSQTQIKRETESAKYDEVAAQGGQEYSIWVRQFGTGGDTGDKGWLPCGAIAVPRAAQVSDAIFANEAALKKAILRVYPKLKGLENEFEYGYNLKVYPDDPVETANKNGPRASGISVGNWINTLLSPVDASAVPPPPISNED
jgi:hypothetical protein